MVRLRVALVLVAVWAAASLPGWWTGAPRPPVEVTVTAAVDGDTVEVAWDGGRAAVRILGVDTPETVHPDRGVECYGPEAAAFTKAMLLGRSVTLRYDVEHLDHYGRLLADVVVDGRSSAEALLGGGYARLLVIPPNGAGGRRLLDVELAARAAGVGLWSACR